MYEHVKQGEKHDTQTMDTASQDQEEQAMASHDKGEHDEGKEEEDVTIEQEEDVNKVFFDLVSWPVIG